MRLNVMVIENGSGVSRDAEQELRAAGHTVLTCHEPDERPFPCKGVTDPSACPLRSHSVDVALLVRKGHQAEPAAAEDGARCALVQRVPLVVAGDRVLDPYDEFATRTLGRTYDVVNACELGATAPIATLGRRATAVLHEVVDTSGVSAEVTRRDGRLQVRIVDRGAMTEAEGSRAAVRIAMALRELDPFAAGIDIGIDGS